MPRECTRRTAMKTGLSALSVLALGTGTSAASPLGNSPQFQKNDNSKVKHQGEYEYSQSSSLHWYGAYQPATRSGWRHDMALTTCADSEFQDDYWISGEANEITATEYSLTVIDPDGQNVLAEPHPDYFGVHPNSGGIDVPQWVETPFDLTIGSLHPTVAFALAADDMYQALTPKDGFSYRSDGVDFRHSTGLFEVLWSETAHFNRFELENLDGAGGGNDLLVTATTGTTEFATEPEVTFDVFLFEDNTPSVFTSSVDATDDLRVSSFGPSDVSVDTRDPERMTAAQQDALGIHDVYDADIRSPHGERIQYVATNLPVTIASNGRKVEN